MANSHFVPRLTLRQFGDKICLFNVKTGEYKENVQIEKSFFEENYYTNEIEKKLNMKIESQFGNLFSNKLKKGMKIELTQSQVNIIKKFLLISIIRCRNEEFIVQEKNFYDTIKNLFKADCRKKGFSELFINVNSKIFNPPFKEKIIPNESNYDYWMRSLKVVLETDGTPQEILKKPGKTYLAYRWAKIVETGYLAFWDSEFVHEEFVITDIGMTSENEIEWNGFTKGNKVKSNFLFELFKKATDTKKLLVLNEMCQMFSVSENFMMFPISAQRMIVLINPFFKFRLENMNNFPMISLDKITYFTNEKLFYPHCYKNNKFIYVAKQLNSEETKICNIYFLDRINEWLGFSSLNKVASCLKEYYLENRVPFIPRVDYTELYKIINERYGASIDINNIKGVRR